MYMGDACEERLYLTITSLALGSIVFSPIITITGTVSDGSECRFNGNGHLDVGDAAKIAFYLAGGVSEL
jgi:hypothetical protein